MLKEIHKWLKESVVFEKSCKLWDVSEDSLFKYKMDGWVKA